MMKSLSQYLVLCSAGLDSAVLLAHLAQSGDGSVQPVYVSVGLAWEATERDYLSRLLAAPAFQRDRRVQPPITLRFDMHDIYPPTHWAIRGTPPAFDTPDEDVYIVGRNVTLLTKAALCAATHRIPYIAIGPLAGNPFPDATPGFFDAMSQALSMGLDHNITIVAPFLEMEKSDVIKRGAELGVDFSLTLSCMDPRNSQHCGQCSKCRERRDAFVQAGIPDPTTYATPTPR